MPICPPQAAGNGYASAHELNPNSPQEKNMKKTIVRIILVTFLLLASGAAPILASADGIPKPMCWPNPCSVQ
jgi:fatty acid desaturase